VQTLINRVMKPSALLLGILLTAAPLAAGWAPYVQAAGSLDAGDQQRHRRDNDDDDPRRRPPQPSDDQQQQRRPQGGYDQPQPRREERRDDGINRAIAAGQSRGRVLDAGPQNGSVYWVRVDTGHGRVDLLIDGATGRVIGER